MTNAGPWFTVVIIGDETFCSRAEPALQQSDSLLVTGAVGPDQAVATAVGRAPDVVVIADPPGAEETAAGLAGAIGAALPASRILVVADGAPSDPAALVGAWVGGVISLDGPVPLAEAVRALALGEAILDPTLAAAVLDRHAGIASQVPLTATEEEVLRRLAAGDPVDTVAAEYAVSERLVRLHAGGALARLHPFA